jgi:hypothetical protein
MISANVDVAGVPSSNLVTSTAEIVVVVVEILLLGKPLTFDSSQVSRW